MQIGDERIKRDFASARRVSVPTGVCDCVVKEDGGRIFPAWHSLFSSSPTDL